MDNNTLQRLRSTIANATNVQFAVLVGSRSMNNAREDSDWDIAVYFNPSLTPIQRFENFEVLRTALAQAIDVVPEKIDLIDLHSAGLAMREQVVNHGEPLVEGDGLMFCYFRTRTWREIEALDWESRYAA